MTRGPPSTGTSIWRGVGVVGDGGTKASGDDAAGRGGSGGGRLGDGAETSSATLVGVTAGPGYGGGGGSGGAECLTAVRAASELSAHLDVYSELAGRLRAAGRMALDTGIGVCPAAPNGERLPGEGVLDDELPALRRLPEFSGGIRVVWPVLRSEHSDEMSSKRREIAHPDVLHDE